MSKNLRVIVLLLLVLAAGCSRVESTPKNSAGTTSAVQRLEKKTGVAAPQITSVALLAAGNASAKQFVRMQAEQTNIDFVHRWNPPDHDFDFRTLLNGGAACIGDYDGDGRADVYLTRPGGGNRLYRNLGDFRFEDVTDQAGLNDEFWGMGATFLDIDNDGDLDLYACAFQSPNRLYVNLGNGKFEEQAEKFGLDFNGASVMFAAADYDNDGLLDGYLVTNRQQPKDHAEFRRRRREGFHIEGNVVYYDKDLRELLDVIPMPGGNFSIMAGQRDRLFHNTGHGSFEEVGFRSGIMGNDIGLAATWWDYNADGLADLYVSNDFQGPDRLYQNRGDGSFSDVALYALPHMPWSSMGADVADINNDGRLDFMASDMSASSHYRDKVTMGDMSSMGWFLERARPPQYIRNSVYINSGAERFMEAAHLCGLSSTDWTWSVKCADLDDDGRVDVFITNGMTRDWENADLDARAEELGGYESPEGLKFWLDQPPNAERNLAFRNTGDLQFDSVGAAWGLDHLGVSFGAAMGDLDGDGDLDLVVNNYEEPAGIYRNDVSTGHRIKLRLVGSVSNRWGIGAMIRLETAAGTQVRYLTLARGVMSADQPLVHFGLGAQETVDRLTVHWPSGRVQEFEKLAADRFYTITEPDEPPREHQSPETDAPTMFTRSSALSKARHLEEPYDDFANQPLLPHKLSQLGPGMAWGDLDGDGRDDCYLGGGAGYAGKIFRNMGDGDFQQLRVTSTRAVADQDAPREDMGVLIFDADADADLDVYVVSGGVECEEEDELLRDRLYLNDGQGGLTTAPEDALPDIRDSGGCVAAADFDRDGDLDLFVGGRVVPGQYPVTPSSRLLRNDSRSTQPGQGSGIRFTDVTADLAPGLATTGLVTSALWSDANGDGWLDLLVTHDWGPVKLFLNEQGKLADHTFEAGLADRLGWYNGIAGRDLDGDGDIDYVVTNAGLNTKYHASAHEPARIYYGDFEGDGKMHIVEAKFKGDQLLPVRGKSCSQNAMPIVKNRFPQYHDFASALLPEIYTPQCLDDALTVEANSLESGVLINDGEAHFTFRALPRIAQISPGYGVVLTEVDGDGHPDLYLVQNSYSPQRETGRMDGGVSLLLLGNGNGIFEPIWPGDSGLIVSYDAKSLAVTDLNGDGWPDFVIGVNDQPMEAFTANGAPGRQVVNVRLKGSPGNLRAIGARVSVELFGGKTQTAEVAAGGGYLSQSSATLTFGLPSGETVRALRVRWPDGSESSHSGADDLVDMEIVAPTGS